jgi:protein-L-isoaspartate(D-aspartate) O-methyltransferase
MPTNEQMIANLLAFSNADKKTAECMRKFPREIFLFPEQKEQAYADVPLPTVKGQTTSAPSMIGIMLREAELREGMKVFEVGTGSGWQTALMSCLVGPKGKVITSELVEELAKRAERIFKELGIRNTTFLVKDGAGGNEEEAPYDRIIVGAAAEEVPKALEAQLREGGILIIPLATPAYQELFKFVKRNGKLEGGSVCPVMFVPLSEKK